MVGNFANPFYPDWLSLHMDAKYFLERYPLSLLTHLLHQEPSRQDFKSKLITTQRKDPAMHHTRLLLVQFNPKIHCCYIQSGINSLLNLACHQDFIPRKMVEDFGTILGDYYHIF